MKVTLSIRHLKSICRYVGGWYYGKLSCHHLDNEIRPTGRLWLAFCNAKSCPIMKQAHGGERHG